MYLKRLELYGFKSFAQKTSFDFGQGLTAIVGPNGSGMSNIADALRWVMGEQSTRLIRAKKLDDVIYAGSEKRSRSDRVEVAMVLDNSTGWLPIDDDELTISRRGTRSGDSDYYLNGRKAKLRDIQTILATAAVSQNSYAIIGQGLVESILNLRAEDRRQLIEEAADIQRYRYKIEDAENRVKQTAENVERVKLLVKEIAPRMGQLERQARRAGEHAQISMELQQALREYYEHRWAQAQESLTVARAAHDQAQAEFLQARVALETVQRELADITSQLEESRHASASALAEKDRLDGKLREVERRMAVAAERQTILQARRQEMWEELEAVEGERERARAVMGSGDGERERAEAAVAEARKVLQEKQGEFASLEAEYRESHVHAADADARAKRLQAVAAEMKSRIRKLLEAGEALERDVRTHDLRRRSTVKQMAELVRVLHGLRTQDTQFLADVSGTGERRRELQEEINELRGQLSKLEADQNARRGKVEGLEARLSVLEEASVQPPGDAIVSLTGAVASVYEFLRVPRGLEEAIASVLEDRIEAFVFEHQEDAVTAIDTVAREGGPRTTAIPMDAMKPSVPLSLMKERGVLGSASNLIRYPAKYEKLVNMLLGRVVVVEDAETAVRLLKRRVGTIVTTDGVVFHPTGEITGGRPQDAKAFTLAYERDLEEIPREIERLERSIMQTERQAESVREELRAAEASLAGISGEADSVISRRLEMQNAVASRQQKLAQLRGEMLGVMGAIENVRAQQQSYREQAETLEKEREGLLAEAEEAAETAKHLGSADKLFEERRRVLEAAVDAATEELGRVDAELRSVSVQRENAGATLARVDAQASAKEVQLRGLELELESLAETLATDEREAGEARTKLETVLEMLPGQDGAHHLEARQADLHKQVVTSQNRMFEAERHTLETEARVQKWETEIDDLTRHIADDGLIMRQDGTVVAEKGGILDVEMPAWMAAENEEGGDTGLRPISGGAIIDPERLERDIERLRVQLRALGPVNVEAQVDYEDLRERHDFLSGQLEDLKLAEEALGRAIRELTDLMKRKFEITFTEVARNFEENFKTFFGGGHAKLKMTDPKHPETTGIEVEARPPGKKTKNLTQLSGGEKSLTSVALLFALLQANPAPFCVLDEVDAMLDEANVGRFAKAIKEQSKATQFIVITHNRRTIEQADSIYGISMAPDAASRVLSMRLGDALAEAAAQN